PSIAPPAAFTPLTVVYSRAVSTSQMIRPSRAAYALKCPSTPPEKTTPGIAVTAADCAGLQPGLLLHPGCGVVHATSPFSSVNANSPPPTFGSKSCQLPKEDRCAPGNASGSSTSTPSILSALLFPSSILTSETATYTCVASAADPHCT